LKNVITKYAFATRVGYIPNNNSKVNQDSYILQPTMDGPKNNYRHFFGVCDGHGSLGHHASSYIKENLPIILQNQLQIPDQARNESFKKAFMICDKKLSHDTNDYKLSGSTVCTILFEGTTIHSANVGDSRAIICSIEDGKIVGKHLTNDHKPELPEERSRILGMGGRIDSFHDSQNNNEPLGP
jgi:serine/threonine protein phosphatase PrpC